MFAFFPNPAGDSTGDVRGNSQAGPNALAYKGYKTVLTGGLMIGSRLQHLDEHQLQMAATGERGGLPYGQSGLLSLIRCPRSGTAALCPPRYGTGYESRCQSNKDDVLFSPSPVVMKMEIADR